MQNTPGSVAMDTGAFALLVAAGMQYLPAIAAMLSAIWFAIRIIESRTVQTMLGSRAWIKRPPLVTPEEDKENGSL